MKTGSLVPDAMILRLITHELQTRGWLTPPGGMQPLTLSTASAALDFSTDDFVTPSTLTNLSSPSNDPSASFILDGFPRTASQATALDALIPINLAISLKTPTPILLSRISSRWIHAPSGRIYNTSFNAPKTPGRDDVTGEKLTKRPDDDEETWVRRLRKFEETSEPLLEFYGRKGVLWEVEGGSSDEISPKVFGEVERRFVL